MTEIQQFRIESNIRLIVLRWLYLFVGIGLVGGYIYSRGQGWTDIYLAEGPLIILLLAAAVINLPLLLIAQYAEAKKLVWFSFLLAFFHIVFDLVLFGYLIYLIKDVVLVAPILLLIPVTEAVVLLGTLGVVTTGFGAIAVLIGLTAENVGDISWENISLELWYGLVYVLVGLLLSYHYRLVKPLNIFTTRRRVEQRNLAQDEQLQWVRKYGQKMEENNRKLYAKELELKLAKQELEMLDQAKSKFISVTAHQMRTPLSAIKWTFDMMLSGQLGAVDEEQKKFLGQGFEAADKMIAIVNSLVQVDHIESKWSQDMALGKIDLVVLIDNILLEFTNHLISKNISLKVEKPSNKLPLLDADPGKLRMVIENLIDNAIKYTPKGGVVTITIKDDKLNSAHSSIGVSVTDSGIGIPTSEQSKIFQKFFRASNAVASEPDGSGVGLFIAKDIIESHQGSLWFESSPGAGSTFHISLPISQAEKPLV